MSHEIITARAEFAQAIREAKCLRMFINCSLSFGEKLDGQEHCLMQKIPARIALKALADGDYDAFRWMMLSSGPYISDEAESLKVRLERGIETTSKQAAQERILQAKYERLNNFPGAAAAAKARVELYVARLEKYRQKLQALSAAEVAA